MQLTSILPPEAVLASVSARDKKQVIKLLSAHAAKLTGLGEREVFSVLMEREHIGCTGMGNGVCIPHGRFINLSQVRVVFAQLEKPIEFGAADAKPVDLVFLLLSPSLANTEHIKALAVLSRLLRDKQLCENLRKSKDAATLHALLTADHTVDAA